MAKLKWDVVGSRFYRTGVDHGVLFPQKDGAYPKAVPWSGLTSVSESPSGAEDNPVYADNIKYLNLKSAEEFGAAIECITYPDEWAECNGESELVEGLSIGMQRRNTFGFSWRNKLGNDTEGEDYGYEIHMVYGCSATPSEKSNTTINDSPEAGTFSYTITTTPVAVSGLGPDGKPYKPTAHLIANSRTLGAEKMQKLEEILYGTDGDGSEGSGTDGRLPFPDELKELFAAG